MEAIKRRMDDYMEYITPQFSHTDINFQRIPTSDTSNPIISREVPSADESLVVIRVKKKLIKNTTSIWFILTRISHRPAEICSFSLLCCRCMAT